MKVSIKAFLLTLLTLPCLAFFSACGEDELTGLRVSGQKVVFDIGESFSLGDASFEKELNGEEWQACAQSDITVDSSNFVSQTSGVYEIKFSYEDLESSYKVLVIDQDALVATYGETLADVELGVSGLSFKADLATSVGALGENKFVVVYENIEFEITILVEQATPAITAPTGLTATYGETLVDIELPEGFTFKDSLETLVGNAGERTFTVVYTPADTTNYKSVELEVTVLVEKATPSYTPPTNLTATEGESLADVALPEGFSFKDALTTLVGEPGNNTFAVIFTPSDTQNYLTVELNVTIVVSAQQPVGILENFGFENIQGLSEDTFSYWVASTNEITAEDGVTDIATFNAIITSLNSGTSVLPSWEDGKAQKSGDTPAEVPAGGYYYEQTLDISGVTVYVLAYQDGNDIIIEQISKYGSNFSVDLTTGITKELYDFITAYGQNGKLKVEIIMDGEVQGVSTAIETSRYFSVTNSIFSQVPEGSAQEILKYEEIYDLVEEKVYIFYYMNQGTPSYTKTVLTFAEIVSIYNGMNPAELAITSAEELMETYRAAQAYFAGFKSADGSFKSQAEIDALFTGYGKYVYGGEIYSVEKYTASGKDYVFLFDQAGKAYVRENGRLVELEIDFEFTPVLERSDYTQMTDEEEKSAIAFFHGGTPSVDVAWPTDLLVEYGLSEIPAPTGQVESHGIEGSTLNITVSGCQDFETFVQNVFNAGYNIDENYGIPASSYEQFLSTSGDVVTYSTYNELYYYIVITYNTSTQALEISITKY